MLNQLNDLKTRIESDTEAELTAEEIEFLDSITTISDLRGQTYTGAILALAYDAALALGATTIEAQIITGEADPDSLTTITLRYHDGEYLSGYELHGGEAKLMEKIGLAKWVSGWGYYVDDEIVKALGTEFFYHQAIEYARPQIEAKANSKQADLDRIHAIYAEAARTNQPVILREYEQECDQPDCSFDMMTVYAMPNGTTKTTRTHTW